MESHRNITVMDIHIILIIHTIHITNNSIRHHLHKHLSIPIPQVRRHRVIMEVITGVLILDTLCINSSRVRLDKDRRQDKDNKHLRVLGMGIVGRE